VLGGGSGQHSCGSCAVYNRGDNRCGGGLEPLTTVCSNYRPGSPVN
jgi:hypothetical protein